MNYLYMQQYVEVLIYRIGIEKRNTYILQANTNFHGNKILRLYLYQCFCTDIILSLSTFGYKSDEEMKYNIFFIQTK